MNMTPSIGLASMAANCPDHEVYIGDLVLKRRDVKGAIHGAIKKYSPDVVGLSAMTFQFPTLIKIARYIKKEFPDIPIVIGGYHATILYKEIADEDGERLFDSIIRGEGDLSFNELLDALNGRKDLSSIKGLSYRVKDRWHHNSRRPAEDLSMINLPDRSARIWKGYHIFNHQADTVETSRGCLQHCNFCSIKQMYGDGRREYSIDRVMDDIRRAKEGGVKHLFFTDDNITSDASGLTRYEDLLDAIIENGHNDIKYAVQVSSIGMGTDERIAVKMRRAGFSIAFLGMENMSSRNLAFFQKGQIINHTKRAVDYLRRNGICIMGGVILGAENDTEEDFRANFDFMIESKIDTPLVQVLTPYPGTVIRDVLHDKNLITNYNDWEKYHGHLANVRTKHLSTEQLDFLVWKHFNRYLKWRLHNFLSLNFVRRYVYCSIKGSIIYMIKSLPKAIKKIGKDEYGKFKIDFQELLDTNSNLI